MPSLSKDNTFEVSHQLRGGKHEYPASCDEHLSPFNTLLFLVSKSSQNLQLSDEYLSARYIAKYAAGIEERANARIDPVSFKEIKINCNGLKNVKNAGCKVKDKVTDRKKLVQVIPQVETVWWMLNFKYVHSSVSFVHLSTHEKTEHGAFIKNQSNSDSSTNYPLYIIKTFTLPPFRQFTQSQMLILKDSMSSEYTRCEISIFSGRPPALLCVDNPVTYFKWFKRVHVKNPEKKLTNDVNTSHWIDIFGFLVFLRRCYLEDFEIYLRKLRTEGHMNLHRLEDDTTILFLENDRMNLKTIDDDQVQVVTSNIVPTNPFKFLVHYVLSYGHFETEIDLFNQQNMIEVYKQWSTGEQNFLYSRRRFCFDKTLCAL